MSDYTKQDWKDGTDGGTPITAARLAHIENGIAGHTHAASDIASGTLSADRLPTVPIAHGGTGATTAAAALTALGAASASDLATVRDSVSHTVFQADASKLKAYCDEKTGTMFFAVIASSGAEYRLGCTKNSIYLDRYDTPSSGVTLWTK
jgi:hypothetical protein